MLPDKLRGVQVQDEEVTGEHSEAFQLTRIAVALETIVAKDATKHLDNNVSALYQLAGSCAGFADELDAILSDPDAFKRAQRLRDLQQRARRIANGYAEQAEKARLEADSELESEDAKDTSTP